MNVEQIGKDIKKLSLEEKKEFHGELIKEYKDVKSKRGKAALIVMLIIAGHFALEKTVINSISFLNFRLDNDNIKALYIFILPIYSHYLYRLVQNVFTEVLFDVVIRKTSKYESLTHLQVLWNRGITLGPTTKRKRIIKASSPSEYLYNFFYYIYIVLIIIGIIILFTYPFAFLVMLYLEVVASIEYDFKSIAFLITVTALILMNMGSVKKTLVDYVRYQKKLKNESLN